VDLSIFPIFQNKSVWCVKPVKALSFSTQVSLNLDFKKAK